MKRLARLLVLLAVLAGCALYLFYPRLTAPHVQSAFETASVLRQAVGDGRDEAVFRTEEIELDEVYAALEAVYPYAFALHSTDRPNGTTTLRVEVSRPARQRQARAYAEQLAAAQLTDGMTAPEKLRALHDALIRLCVYDSETAERAPQDGATAPFAADGALLDHKAVCAGYGRAYAMLCEAAGLRAIYIASEEMNHGWNAVRLDGTTYFIDCTFDDPVPDRGEYVSDRFFLRTADELADTHTWDRAFYERVLDALGQK